MFVIGATAALFSSASWAFGTVMFDRVGKSIPAIGITFLKGVCCIILMAILLLFYNGLESVGLRDFIFLAISGIIGIAVGDSLFFKSLQDLGAKTQVLFFLLGQLLTMILSLMFLDELLSAIQYIGAIILLIGITIVIWDKQENHPNKIRGIMYATLSIICFSISSILSKVAIGNVEVITGSFYRMVFGTIFTLGYGVAFRQFRDWMAPLKHVNLCFLFVTNCIVITYGGFLLSMVALKNITVSLYSVLATTEPIFVILFAFLLNKELATKRELVGCLVAVIGLLLILKI